MLLFLGISTTATSQVIKKRAVVVAVPVPPRPPGIKRLPPGAIIRNRPHHGVHHGRHKQRALPPRRPLPPHP